MATYNNIKKIKIGDNIFNLYDSGNSGGTITSVKTTAGAHTAINVTSGAANFNVPTKTSHLTNDSGFLTAHQTYTSFTGKPTANQTPSFGSTFTISQISQSTSGQVSGTDRTVTIPSTIATNTAVGLVKPWYTHTAASTGPTTGNNTTAVAVNAISTTSGKYYAVEADSNGRLFVNVPWTNVNSDYITLSTLSDYAGLDDLPTITLNGSQTDSPTFYAPTSAGTSGQFLYSQGSNKAPIWVTPDIIDEDETDEIGYWVGSNIYLNKATTSAPGLMSVADKTVLDAVSTTYLPLSGGNLTGDVSSTANISANNVTVTGELSALNGKFWANTITTATNLKLTFNSRSIELAANTNDNIGLWDTNNSKWILYNDTSGNTHTGTIYVPNKSGMKSYLAGTSTEKWLISMSNDSSSDYVAVGSSTNNIPVGLYGSNVTLSRAGNLSLSGAALASGGLNNIRVGTTSSISVNTNAYVDTSVTFSPAFSHVPFVICSILSESTGAGTGRMVASAIKATKTGFTIRLFNGDTITRAPAVTWLAYAIQG